MHYDCIKKPQIYRYVQSHFKGEMVYMCIWQPIMKSLRVYIFYPCIRNEKHLSILSQSELNICQRASYAQSDSKVFLKIRIFG